MTSVEPRERIRLLLAEAERRLTDASIGTPWASTALYLIEARKKALEDALACFDPVVVPASTEETVNS